MVRTFVARVNDVFQTYLRTEKDKGKGMKLIVKFSFTNGLLHTYFILDNLNNASGNEVTQILEIYTFVNSRIIETAKC